MLLWMSDLLPNIISIGGMLLMLAILMYGVWKGHKDDQE